MGLQGWFKSKRSFELWFYVTISGEQYLIYVFFRVHGLAYFKSTFLINMVIFNPKGQNIE